MTTNGTTAITGRLVKAVVDGELVLRLTSGAITDSAGTQMWGDSDSQGHTNRKKGRQDRTFRIAGKFDTGKPIYNIFEVGDVITLAIWKSASAGDYWAFPSAIIDTFDFEMDADGQTIVGWNATGGEDGKSYYPGEAGAPTYSLPSS